MDIVHPSDLEPILAGNPRARRAFVDALTPVVRAHVTRALFRHRGRALGRDVRQEMADMTQEVFLAMFADDGHWLRAWSPARGLSFANFVGLLAERHVGAIVRSGKKSPWKREMEGAERAGSLDRHIEQADFLRALIAHLDSELSPRGRAFLRALFFEEQSVHDATLSLGASPDVVYAWRNRIIKRARRIGGGLDENVVAPVRFGGVSYKKGEKETSMATISHDLIAQLRAWPELLKTLVEGLSAEDVKAPSPNNAFSVVEHAWHLADLEEEAFALRIARILDEDSPHLPDFNGDLAAKIGKYRERDVGPAVARFALARNANLAKLTRVLPEQWERTGALEGVGTITLADLACRMLDHDRAHAKELLELFSSIHAAPAALPALAEMSRAAKPVPCAA